MPTIIAIVGATCSGKSSLALKLAPLLNAYIFSIDSLSIYKEIDIASAKPSKEELASVSHFAINVLLPCENVHAGIFLKLLEESIIICKQDNKNLIIVGGSSFYLKSIIQGLSIMPSGNLDDNEEFLRLKNANLCEQYAFLQKIDSVYAGKIASNDTYRIQKGLEIFFLSNMPPTLFFLHNPPIPFSLPIKLYHLFTERQILCQNIAKRTKNMLEIGILDEADMLLQTYGKTIQPFQSIGLKECLMVLENRLPHKDLESLITIHTRQLAKRQTTFNTTQFQDITVLDSLLDSQVLLDKILSDIKY